MVAKYVLDPTETALLHELCRTADELDALTAAIADESPGVVGRRVSRGIRCWPRFAGTASWRKP
ncbi:hypothetical protein A9W99_07490 [Mycobacterium sp. 1164966.3]|nr:hypothetical protein A9W99_07490 [Mycobacterium sp. 1164966.3]